MSLRTLCQYRSTLSPVSLRLPPPPPGFRSQRCKSCDAESLCCRWRQPLLGTDGCPRCTSRRRLRGRNSAASLRSQSRRAAKKHTRRKKVNIYNCCMCKKKYIFYIFQTSSLICYMQQNVSIQLRSVPPCVCSCWSPRGRWTQPWRGCSTGSCVWWFWCSGSRWRTRRWRCTWTNRWGRWSSLAGWSGSGSRCGPPAEQQMEREVFHSQVHAMLEL